jgi:hypothetical protein
MSHSRTVPLTAVLLALLWCLAQQLDRPVLVTAAVVLIVAATSALAVQRRRSRALALLIVGINLILAVLLFSLLLTDPLLGLYLQLALIATLAPLVPLVYAITFEPDSDQDEAP